MNHDQLLIDKAVLLEARLTKVESSNLFVQDEIKEIKRYLRWLIGIVFSLNSTIIGLLAKGFNIV